MKNFFKFLGIIAMVAVMGFGFVACDGDDDGGNGNGGGGGGGQSEQGVTEASGTLRADNWWTGVGSEVDYAVVFNSSIPDSIITITTNLPHPNDSFELNSTGASGNTKSIYELTKGQEVNWTATISSGRFMYTINRTFPDSIYDNRVTFVGIEN